MATGHFALSKSIAFDGAGNLSWTATQNLEGTISAIPAGPETDVVQADGALTIINTGGFMEMRVYIKS